MLLYAYLPKQPISIYFAVVVLFLLGSFEKLMNLKKGQAASVLFLLGINIVWFTAVKVFADDGGVAEAGGFINWIGSPGSGIAVVMGAPPAIGSALGGILGIITNSGVFIDIYELEDIYAELGDDMFENTDELEEMLDGLHEPGDGGIGDEGGLL